MSPIAWYGFRHLSSTIDHVIPQHRIQNSFLTRQLLVTVFDFKNERGSTAIRRFGSPQPEKSEALATEFSSVHCLFARYLQGDGVQHESV
jgi:hypothetical protein